MKKIKQKLTATWEIIATTEYVESLDRAVNDSDLRFIYQGLFVPALLEHRVDRKQVWNVVIKTTAKSDDGVIHEHEMEWQFDKLMSIKEVIDGAKHIKVNQNGIKTRWKGIARHWLSAVDVDLKDTTAISAWATATCTGLVQQRNPANKLFDSLQIHVGAIA